MSVIFYGEEKCPNLVFSCKKTFFQFLAEKGAGGINNTDYGPVPVSVSKVI